MFVMTVLKEMVVIAESLLIQQPRSAWVYVNLLEAITNKSWDKPTTGRVVGWFSDKINERCHGENLGVTCPPIGIYISIIYTI